MPADARSDPVPFAHVAEVDRSVAFYGRLGFERRFDFCTRNLDGLRERRHGCKAD